MKQWVKCRTVCGAEASYLQIGPSGMDKPVVIAILTKNKYGAWDITSYVPWIPTGVTIQSTSLEDAHIWIENMAKINLDIRKSYYEKLKAVFE